MLLFVNYYSAYEGTKSFGDLPADQLHDTANALRTAVSRKLRSGSTAPAAALCRRELLYHWFPKGDRRAAITADEKDFPSPYFPPGWDRVLNIHGQGQRVHYSITLRPTVGMKPVCCRLLDSQSSNMLLFNSSAYRHISEVRWNLCMLYDYFWVTSLTFIPPRALDINFNGNFVHALCQRGPD